MAAAGHMEVCELPDGRGPAEVAYVLELRGMFRNDLQALAKKHGIKASLKSEVIIREICQQRRATVLLGGNLESPAAAIVDEQRRRRADVVREVKMEFEELTRRHMADLERLAAKASKAFAQHGVAQCEEVAASLYDDAITTSTKAHEVVASAISVGTAKMEVLSL